MMKHKIEGKIEMALTFSVLGRRGRVEVEAPPELVFENPRKLQEMIDEEIDKLVVDDAMAQAPQGIA